MSYRTLVSTETLAQHLDDPAWVIVDCRFALTDPQAGRRAYAASHLPGARYAHLDEDLSAPVTPATGRHPLPDPALLAEKLGTWGIDGSKQVAVYDDSFGAMAGRLWWLLRWLGHREVALLDGGFPKWKREGRPTTQETPAVKPVRFTPRVDEAMWVDADAVQRALQEGGYRLLDARPEERFSGERETLDPVAGHVPGALNHPFEDNLDFDGTFLGTEELRELYRDKCGGVPPERVIHMCGSGVTACHNVIAMEHAGLSGPKLYAGSWSEWIRDPDRPVATGEE